MKKILIRIAGCVFTAVLSILGVLLMGRLLNPESTSESMNSIKAFHSMEENSIDVMFFGSSHAWKGIDTRVLRDEYNISSFNYGGNWQRINTTLLFIRDAYRTQTPKVIFVDTYVANEKLQNCNMDGQIYYTRAISDFYGKREFLNDCFGKDWKKYGTYYFPLVMFHDNWAVLNKDSLIPYRSKAGYIESLGYDPSNEIVSIDLSDSGAADVQKDFDAEAIAELDKIVDICNKNGTKLIFYTCPYVGRYEYADAMQKYAEENGCTYVNLFEYVDEIGIDGATDFRDSQHLNDSGAAKVTRFLVDNYM